MKIEWTYLLLPIIFFVIGWLVVPSPFHECPKLPVVKPDSTTMTIVYPADTLKGNAQSPALTIKKPKIKKSNSEQLFNLDTAIVYETKDSLNGTSVLFRSTTNISVHGDSITAYTIHDWNVIPKAYEEKKTTITIPTTFPMDSTVVNKQSLLVPVGIGFVAGIGLTLLILSTKK